MNSTYLWCSIFLVFDIISGASQASDWTEYEFNGSMSQILKEIDNNVYLLVDNGATNEIIPGVDYKLTSYQIQFDANGSLDFTPVEFITFSSDPDSLYATLCLDYIPDTREWLIVQTYNLSPGKLRFKFILCDEDFNVVANNYVDTFGYVNIHFNISTYKGHTFLLGTILGPPKDRVVFLDYNHSFKGYLPKVKIAQTSPYHSTWITSMFIDPRTKNMLVFYYNGIQELDTNLNQIHNYLAMDIHTHTHGQVISSGNYYYSHGAYRPDITGFKLILIQKYDTLFNVIFTDTLGSRAHDNYPFVFNSIDYRNDEILVGGHLDGPFSHFDVFSSIKKFYLAKYDTLLNRIWYKEYGGDRAYWMTGLKILQDESIMAYGFITDTIDGFRHAYVLHVAENGDLISSTELDPNEYNHIRLINEGNGIFRIANTENLQLQLFLFDQKGVNILNKNIIDNNGTIDLSALPAAGYFYSIANKSKIITSGKLVKTD
jgi:hypothetical protein